MTDAPTDASSPIAAVPPADPLARLHHMSTTAGITTQEYVAINVASVVTVVLGMLSLAVLLFHQVVLLVIPAAAITVMAGWASLMVLTVAFLTWAGVLDAQKSHFDRLTDFAMFGALIFETMAVLTIFVLRRTMPDAPRPYRCSPRRERRPSS